MAIQPAAYQYTKRVRWTACLLVWGCTTWAVLGMQISVDAPSIAGEVDLATSEVFPIDLHAPVRHVQVGGTSGELADAARGEEPAAERLVYSNTLGTVSFAPGENVRVADDVMTTAGPGCPITRLEFMVNTQVNPALAGGPVTVSWALYNICPGAVPPEVLENYLVLNDVTEGSVQLTEDGLHVVAVALSQPVAINGSFWLSLIFSRANAGAVVGAPATEGFSDDRYHQGGSYACATNFGDFPPGPHGSFHVQLWSEDCAASHPGYRSTRETGPQYNPGANYWIVDDLKLLGGPCNMVGYEVAIRPVGTFNFEFRESCAGPAIPGTERTQIASTSNPNMRILRFAVDPPVALPESAWFAARVNSSVTARFVASGREPVIGGNEDLFGLQAPGATTCTEVNALSGNHDALHLIVYCESEAPLGACCDPYLWECQGGESDGERCENTDDCVEPGTCDAVCRELPEYACWFPPKDSPVYPPVVPPWSEVDACGPEAFERPCGQFACCTPDDTCENLTRHECMAMKPLDRQRQWQIGKYCRENEQSCPFSACLAREGDCSRARTEPGCDSPDCCTARCDADRWCCDVEWDPVCLRWLPECDSRPWNFDCSGLNSTTGAHPVEVNTCVEATNLHQQVPAMSCRNPTPEWLRGSHWYQFVAPADPVRLHTCHTNPPLNDTVFTVYMVGNPSTLETACNSLTEIACVDSLAGCGGGLGADTCLNDLVPGNLYFVRVAVAPDMPLSLVRFDIEAPCGGFDTNRSITHVAIDSALDSEASAFRPGSAARPESAVDGAIAGPALHHEVPNDPPLPAPSIPPPGVIAGQRAWARNGFTSVQVNVDLKGMNIAGDAANEPSIAVDPSSPNRIVIGWRQFDSVESDFRQAGWAYSHDFGMTWTFPGVLEPGVFRSDPVLGADGNGNFHYYSLTGDFKYQLFSSFDGGMTWPRKVAAFGGDKGWMTIDPEPNGGIGHIYTLWTEFGHGSNFARSTDGGATFHRPPNVGVATWGTFAAGPDQELYSAGGAFGANKSTNAHLPGENPTFDTYGQVRYGDVRMSLDPNPGGLSGQTWVATDRSNGSYRGFAYGLATAVPFGETMTNVVFTRSENGGLSWNFPKPVHPETEGWQWFGTMSVAPNGRIDVFWNDTQPTGQARLSELRYSYSYNAGRDWSTPLAVSPVFDTHIGWPNQNKIGDYYHSVSDDDGVSLAYSATFNGEQDAYFLRIPADLDCNDNGFDDRDDVANEVGGDCNGNLYPDECERDFDGDSIIDECDDDQDNDGVLNVVDVCADTPPGVLTNVRGAPLGDTNEDCTLDLADFWRLRNCMYGGRPGVPAPQTACLAAFDRNGDDQTDFADFAVFQNEYGERQW